MIEWNKIDNKKFENLAYNYITSKYPELQWSSTQRTRDGNRDGNAQYSAPIGVTIKYWYEAKYSKNTNKSIPKSHLDSTLVSCLLDGKVVLLAFITNAYISEDYRRRADTFARQSDNLKILYINGEELENWLYNNPEIELEYFHINSAEKRITTDSITNKCILQNYDLQGNSFIITNTIETGKEYVLYVSFYSSCRQQASLTSNNKCVELIDGDYRFYDDYKCIFLEEGFNSIYIPFRVKGPEDNKLQFALNSPTFYVKFPITNVKILNIYNPLISYSSQLEIQTRLFSTVNDFDNTNGLFYIYGPAGYGKTYLLHDIYSNSKNPFSSFVVSFCGDEEHDAISCFKIFITCLYGNIWEYLNAEHYNQSFDEIEELMIKQVIDQKLYANSVQQVIAYYERKKNVIERKSNRIQVFIDDYHKLNKSNVRLINTFFMWFINQKMNCRLFVFSRRENNSFPYCTKEFEIESIESIDVETTLKQNFKDISTLDIIKKYPLPLNVLHLINIVSRINEHRNGLKNMTKVESQILINDIYNESISNTCVAFGNQLILSFKDNPIVYCIYKIKTGISINALFEFFEDSFDEIYELCRKRIFKESSNNLYPYHDILIESFDAVKSKEMDVILEEFVIFSEKKGYINKSKMFSVLIKIGKSCFWKYKLDAEKYRDCLHEKAEYLQALQIARELNQSIKKPYAEYDASECMNQFVLANCIKYTTSYQRANVEFEKIADLYKTKSDMRIKAISLEAKTEILNNLIWMLDIDEAKGILNEIIPVLNKLYKTKQITGRSLEYAFLNLYNRQMFVRYMLDIGTDVDYKKAINYAQEFNNNEYTAFAKMDYSKCLYCNNFEKAEKLMNEAYLLLKKLPNEKRRTLDAKSELWFINCIKKKQIDYNEYHSILRDMQTNRYLQSMIKIQLKLVMLELYLGESSAVELREKLEMISINNTSIKTGKRHQAFIYHLYAAVFYIEGNIKSSVYYSKKSLSLFNQLGDTYKNAQKNNINVTDNNGFTLLGNDTLNNQFILDTRIW